MLKIYGADLSGPANKIRMLANVLDVPYEYIRISIRDKENRTPKFLKLNPSGKIPVIDDNGFVLFESGAICRYLLDKKTSELYPKDLKTRAIVDQWTDFVTIHVGGAMNKVVFNRVFAKVARADVDERSLEDGLKFLDKFLPIVDSQLKGKEFLAADKLSLADITLVSVLDPCEVANIDLTAYENITTWRNCQKQQSFYTQCHKEYGETLKNLLARK